MSQPTLRELRTQFCTGVGLMLLTAATATFVGLGWKEEHDIHVYYGGSRLHPDDPNNTSQFGGVSTEAAVLVFYVCAMVQMFLWGIALLIDSTRSLTENSVVWGAYPDAFPLLAVFGWVPATICYGIVAGAGFVVPQTMLQWPLFLFVFTFTAALIIAFLVKCLDSEWIRTLWCTHQPSEATTTATINGDALLTQDSADSERV